MQISTQVSYDMSIFLTFHEKVYLILTNFREKSEFRTFSEKSDRSPSTEFLARRIIKRATTHLSKPYEPEFDHLRRQELGQEIAQNPSNHQQMN